MKPSNIGTVFTANTTTHQTNPDGKVPSLMSAEGASLAAKTAPANALVLASVGKPPSNPQHDSMDKVFKG